MMGIDDPIHHLGGSNVPNFLSDPPAYLFLLEVIAAVAALTYWYRNRSRKSQMALIAVLAVVGLLWFLSFYFESLREAAIRRVHGVIDAVNQADTAKAMEHVSDRFEYRGINKSALRNARVMGVLQEYQARITPWDLARDDVQYDTSGKSVTIGFNVNVKGNLGQAAFYVRATCIKDPDGEYRISGFKVYDNVLQKAKGSEFNIPGLGN